MGDSYKCLFIPALVLTVCISGCDKSETRIFPTLDKRAPGSLTESVERDVDTRGVEVREIYEPGIQLTKDSEGFVKYLYNDPADYCTIAFGHLVKLASCDGTESAEFLQGITDARGAELLINDMRRSQLSVMRRVKVSLTDGQYAALCDFVFNVGTGNFRSSTLLKVINAGNFNGVPFQLMRWVKAGGLELPGLKTRRTNEIALFFENQAIPRDMPRGVDLAPIDIDQGELVSAR
jgi:lysozyme